MKIIVMIDIKTIIMTVIIAINFYFLILIFYNKINFLI